MTSFDAKSYIKGMNYDFLKTNKKLGDNIVLLCLGGSHAYGTNVETSDVDIRGIAVNSPDELIGLSDPSWVFENKETDTVIYSFTKIIQLLMKCNPNTVEMLGFDKQDYVYLSDIGEQIIDNKSMFLSQRCAASFGGYATAQRRRLENALARDRITSPERKNIFFGAVRAHWMISCLIRNLFLKIQSSSILINRILRIWIPKSWQISIYHIILCGQ